MVENWVGLMVEMKAAPKVVHSAAPMDERKVELSEDHSVDLSVDYSADHSVDLKAEMMAGKKVGTTDDLMVVWMVVMTVGCLVGR